MCDTWRSGHPSTSTIHARRRLTLVLGREHRCIERAVDAGSTQDTPDAIYRKSSVQSISSDVSSISSDSSSPAKPNRKRNPRISEPPPWSSGGGVDPQGDETWLRGSAPPSDDDTSLISARGADIASSPPLNIKVDSPPESPLFSSHHDHMTRTRSHENSRSYGGKSRSAYDKNVRNADNSKQESSRSYDNSRQSYEKNIRSSRQDSAPRYDKVRPAYDKSINIRSVNSKPDTLDKTRSQHENSIRVQSQQTMDNSISSRSKRETALRSHENSRSQEDPVVSRLDETEAAYQDDDDETSSTTASSTSSLVSSPGSRSSNVSCSSNSSDDSSSGSGSPSPVSHHNLDPDSVSYVPTVRLSHHLDIESVSPQDNLSRVDTDFNKENLRPPSLDSPLPLTRRQKKNRVRRNLELNARVPINRLSRFYMRLGMKDAELHKYLSHYAMTQQQLINFSFPFESKYYANKAVIYSPGRYNQKILDPKAREFVPSYNVSVNKMMLKNQQVLWRPDVLPEGVALNKTASSENSKYSYLTQENCHYHWGKVTKSWTNGVQNCIYSCCNEEQYKTSGCVYAKLHVWSGLKTGNTNNLGGVKRDGIHFYMDWRWLVFPVVNVDGGLIYNTLVKPDCEIIDYNTKYSDSIIVGHGLENDLRALKLIHSHIIDTSVLFPHAFGLPFRRSLKSIVSQLFTSPFNPGLMIVLKMRAHV
ncbi:hypothetical protein WDU94_002796 [Cyamophila willieti]